MAEEHHHNQNQLVDAPVVREEEAAVPAVEVTDRGLFDFMGKKEAEQEEVLIAEFEEKVNIIGEAEEKPEVEDGSLLPKLQPNSDTSSSTSSDEEEGGENNNKEKMKKKKKKGLKEKISAGENKKDDDEAVIAVETCDHAPPQHPPEVVVVGESPSVLMEEKKGFLERLKEKLPGRYKKPASADEEVAVIVPAAAPAPAQPPPGVSSEVVEQKEKKGLLEKIKEKLPGYHPKSTVLEEEDKDNNKHQGEQKALPIN